MKKYFILALSAIALIGLSGCEPKNPGENPGKNPSENPSGNTDGAKVVKISKNQLSLGIDQTEKLTATLDPIPASTVKIVWISDDEKVATVSNGVVTGVGEGIANIIASADGYASDTCIVTITNDAVYDNFQIGGYSLWNFASDEFLLEKDTIVKLTPTGSTTSVMMSCNMKLAYAYIWDNNIVFDGQRLSGDGIMAQVFVPILIVTQEGENQNKLVWQDAITIFDSEDPFVPWNGEPGSVDEKLYGDFCKLYFEKGPENLTDEDWEAYSNAFVGSQMFYFDWSTYGQSFYLGNVMNGSIFAEAEDEAGNTEFLYDAKIQWFDYLGIDRFYGLKVNLEQKGDEYDIKDVVEPYDMRYVEKNYKNYDFSSAAAKFAQPKRQYRIMENNLIGTQAEQQLKDMRREALKNTFLLKH